VNRNQHVICNLIYFLICYIFLHEKSTKKNQHPSIQISVIYLSDNILIELYTYIAGVASNNVKHVKAEK